MRTPDEIIDTSTWAPSDSHGTFERLANQKRTVATFGLLGIVLVGLILAYFRQFAVGLATSTPFQVGVLLVAVATFTHLNGKRSGRAEVNESYWLTVRIPGGAKALLGDYGVAPDGTNVFVAYKGFDPISGKSRPLTVGELGGGAEHTHAKGDRKTARIRLDDANFEIDETAYGGVIVAESDGFKPDPFGRHSDVYLSPPREVKSERGKHLLNEYENLRDEVRRLEDRNDSLRRENTELRHELGRPDRDKEFDEFVERARKVAPAFMGQRPRRRRRDGAGDGDGRNGDRTTERGSPEDNGMTLDDAADVISGDLTLEEAGGDGSGGGSGD